MLFNSLDFILFLPITFFLYWYVFNKSTRSSNLFILLASYVFYGWWDCRFLALIALTSLCSYLSGIFIEKFQSEEKVKRVAAVANIVLNLSILGFFKYYNFFVESFSEFLTLIGLQCNYTSLQLILPVGISFYTFQALSYTIDVYRKKINATHDIVAFFAYISFFPQLVAGPIERATSLLPQFYVLRSFDYSLAVDGLRQILLGLFKKVVIADNCAVWVNEIFNNYENLSSSTLALGAFYFSFQIYCDFSGYSDIALGTAKLFGIKLTRNFNVPYFSRDITEFWRRWHITLNSWFRDYIYIPLGGGRVPIFKKLRNTTIVFLVSGFWHGANWTFITWGLYYALLFIPTLLILNRVGKWKNEVSGGNRWFPTFTELFFMMLTYCMVVVGWIIFRSPDMSTATCYIGKLFSLSLFSIPDYKHPITLLSIIALVIVEWFTRSDEHTLYRLKYKSTSFRYVVYTVLALVIYLCSAPSESFIYFQF